MHNNASVAQTLRLLEDPQATMLVSLLHALPAATWATDARTVPLGDPAMLAYRLHAAGLTRRETELAVLDLAGFGRMEIAQRLSITPMSVTTYWKRIYRKLDLPSRRAFRCWVLQHALAPDAPDPCEHAQDTRYE